MANINNKLFAYIQTKEMANTLSPDIVKQYENSLILINGEKQIWQPLTNSYVGIGTTAYNNLSSYVNDIKLSYIPHVWDNIVNKNVVKNIYGQWAGNEIEGNIGSTKYPIQQGSNITKNKDVVIVGANDKDIINKNGLFNFTSAQSIPIVNSKYSGINVTLQNIGGEIRQGTDEYGLPYTYFDGDNTYSYIIIDDTYTWTYISEKSTYLANFAIEYSKQQANKVYRNLLGLNDEPVYIEKEFEQVVTYDTESGQMISDSLSNVFVKTINEGYKELEYEYKTNNNKTILQTYISHNNNHIVLFELEKEVDPPYSYIWSKTLSSANQETFFGTEVGNTGYLDYVRNKLDVWPVFYDLDTSYTANSNLNIEDGINTIKEVAYILDKITDGDDSGISLVNNIAQNHEDIEELQEWREKIGNESVQSINTQNNYENYLRISNYSEHWDETDGGESTGNVILRSDITLAPISNVPGTISIENNEISYSKFAAYLGSDVNRLGLNLEIIDDSENWTTNKESIYDNSTVELSSGWVKKENISTYLNYLSTLCAEANINTSSLYLIFIKSAINESPSNIIKDHPDHQGTDNFNNVVTDYNINSNDYAYIYIPYTFNRNKYRVSNNIIKALTDVEWVTTYVALSNEIINYKINNNQSEIENLINESFKTKFNSYNFIWQTNGSDDISSYEIIFNTTNNNYNKYISYVGQVNGNLVANVQEFPKDNVYGNTIITSYGAKYTILNLKEILESGLHTGTTILDLNGNPADVSCWVSSDYSFERISLIENMSYLVLLDNSIQTFNKTTSEETIDLNNTYYIYNASNYAYIPIDVQTAIKDGGINQNLKPAQTYYYCNSLSNNKYLTTYNTHTTTGKNDVQIFTYITYLKSATDQNIGLADAYDIRKTIENMFTWIDLSTNKPFIRS